MLVVKVERFRSTICPPLYTPLDWRLDALETGICQVCREPVTFHGPLGAECRRCGFWCDGALTGVCAADWL